MRKWQVAGAAAGVVAVAAAVTVVNLPRAHSDDPSSAATPETTTEITRQTLVDRESHDGTLGHGDTTTVTARGSGTVTMLPASGTTITRGKPIYRLDNKPVTLLYGTLPAYRTLRPGVEGSDVRQLETNLRALGYDGFTVDGEYTSATADAVEDWQDDLGLRETGTVEPFQVAYATGASRVDSLVAETGSVAQPGTELLKLTGTTVVATVDLDVDSQRLARTGATVRVTMPDGTNVPGRITGVETVVEPGQGQEEDTTKVRVTIGFGGAPRGLGAAAVTVGFTAAERKNVLTVEVAALLALAEGGYGLELTGSSGNRTVPVTTGLFADGRVEISGADVRDGLTVAMPS